jgi:ATP-dependent RNA helicase RhlE
VTPVASTAETVEQAIYFVEKADKRSLLSWVLERERIERVLVFTRTKHGANRVAEYLEKRGVAAAAIHGNKSQNARERALEAFKQGRLRALIATDIAARGIDIDELAFVINFDLPNVPEAYVHRIGRTGRAGASGRALSFCESEERPYLADIERLIKQLVPVVAEHPYPSSLGLPRPTDLTPRHARGGQRPAQAAPQRALGQARAQGGERPHGHERPTHHANRPGQGGPRPAPKAAHPASGQRGQHRDARDTPRPADTRDSGRRAEVREAPRRAEVREAPRRTEARDAPRRAEPRDARPADTRGAQQAGTRSGQRQADSGSAQRPAHSRDASRR